jgi:hypothetical protein
VAGLRVVRAESGMTSYRARDRGRYRSLSKALYCERGLPTDYSRQLERPRIPHAL